MFDVGPDNSLVLYFLFAVALFISVIVYFLFKRKLLPAIFTMSVLGNLIMSMEVSAPFYSRFVVWIVFNCWPILNIALLVFIIAKLVLKLRNKKK